MEICTMVLKELNDTLPDKSMAIYLTDHRVKLRKGVVALLGLKEGDRVRFKINGDTVLVGRSLDPNFGYTFSTRSESVTIFNSALARSLRQHLKENGYYRVENENSVKDFTGAIYYSIFYRKYE